MAVVAKVNAQIKNLSVPTHLKGLKGFLAWGGSAQNKKIPQYLTGGFRRGEQGSKEDREKLVTFEEAINLGARNGFDGLSLAALPEFNVTMWDIDDCVTDGVIDPRVDDLFAGTYVEYSPSRKGVRAFTMGQLPDGKSLHGDIKVEVFFSKGAVRLSGDPTPRTIADGKTDVVAPLNERIIEFYHDSFPAIGDSDPFDTKDNGGERMGATLDQAREALSHIDPIAKFAFLTPIGMGLKHEFGDEVFPIWDAWRKQDEENYPGLEKLKRRWESFSRKKGKVITFRHVLKLANEAGAGIHVSSVATLDDFAVVVDQHAANDSSPRSSLIQAAEYASRKPPAWIIKNLLPQTELAVIYGEPGSGKSFKAGDMGLSIARGIDWCGKKVKQGPVVYVAAEGGGGFSKRLEAYAKHHNCDLSELEFYVYAENLNLMQKEDVARLCQKIEEVCQPSVVIFDTFAASMPGANENSSEDVGAAIAHLKLLHKRLGCLCLVVHHSGKDAKKGARGWSGLRAAVDTEIEVTRGPTARYATVKKQKDGEDGETIAFNLQRVVLGVDEDLEEITSCVVVESFEAQPLEKQHTFGRWEQLIIDEAKVQLGKSQDVKKDSIIESVYGSLDPIEGNKRDQRKSHIRRAFKKLENDAHSPIMIKDDIVTWIGDEEIADVSLFHELHEA